MNADGFAVVMAAAMRGARPEPELRVDEWSEEFMILPKSSARPGAYRIFRTPPARRILQCLSPRHPAKRVVIRGASQMLKTQIGLNWMCACIHRAPANILAIEPTDQLAKRLSARLTQTIRDVPALRAVIAPQRSRDSRNTVGAKDYEGGTIYIVTGGSASNLAEIPARYIYIDEVDRLEASVDGEGDPVEIIEARATTFANTCKFLEVSSPTIAGASKIDALYAMGTQEYFAVPCPHCGHRHELVIENFRYHRDDDSGFMTRAWFDCPHCGEEIDERHKKQMVADAALQPNHGWVARSAGDGETVSFHVSAFLAQADSITWLALARQYARAKERLQTGDDEAMKVFYNTRLAISWEGSLDNTTAQELHKRAEPYPPRVVPDRALVVTLTVDTQLTRLEVQAEAWGPGLEHWVIDHQVFMGSPAELPSTPGSVWQRLDAYRRTPFVHAAGALIQASVYGIDSGGANTQDVYNYGAARARAGCLVLKGASKPNRPIIPGVPSKVDVDHRGEKIAGGVMLWMIGTDVAKDHLHNRWKLVDGPGAMHFHQALPMEWFEQLVAERPILKRMSGGFARRIWVKAPGDRNEALDLSVYNLALAHHLGLHKWSELDWQRLRARLVKPTADLFATAALEDAAAAVPEAATAWDAPPPAASDPAPPPPPAAAPALPSAVPAVYGRRIRSRGISR